MFKTYITLSVQRRHLPRSMVINDDRCVLASDDNSSQRQYPLKLGS
jgi:hypothetical protein